MVFDELGVRMGCIFLHNKCFIRYTICLPTTVPVISWLLWSYNSTLMWRRTFLSSLYSYNIKHMLCLGPGGDVHLFPPYVSLSSQQTPILHSLSRKHRSSQLSAHQSLIRLLPIWTETALPRLQRHRLLSWERKWSRIWLYKCNHVHWLSLWEGLALQVGCVAACGMRFPFVNFIRTDLLGPSRLLFLIRECIW